MDSAQAYRLQEARSQSLPMEQKSLVEALTEHPAEEQSLSSIYLATESAPASPFGSLQVPCAAGLRRVSRLMQSRHAPPLRLMSLGRRGRWPCSRTGLLLPIMRAASRHS